MISRLCSLTLAVGALAAATAPALQQPAKKAYIEKSGDRVVVIEFPSFERAKQFYDSPEHVAARKVRAGAAEAQFVLVEGQ